MPKNKRNLNNQELKNLDILRHQFAISKLAKIFHVNKPTIKKAIDKLPRISSMLPISIPTGKAIYESDK